MLFNEIVGFCFSRLSGQPQTKLAALPTCAQMESKPPTLLIKKASFLCATTLQREGKIFYIQVLQVLHSLVCWKYFYPEKELVPNVHRVCTHKNAEYASWVA